MLTASPGPAAPACPRVRVGRFTVYGLSDGRFRLDGGAMFGVVPRVLWERVSPADAQNRVLLGLHPILVTAPDCCVLVETGLGSRHSASFADRFGVEQPPTLAASLAASGYRPEDVDLVVDTHLHWDHAGGNVVARPDGRLAPAFPRATYVVQASHWDEATHLHERNHASFRPDDYLPIAAAGQLRLVDGAVELVPGLSVEPVGGHSRGMQVVRVSSEGATLLFLADLAPTTRHLDYPWIMAYDLFPVETLEQKKRLLRQAAAEGWLLAFHHDPDHHFGRIRLETAAGRERPVFEPIAPEPD